MKLLIIILILCLLLLLGIFILVCRNKGWMEHDKNNYQSFVDDDGDHAYYDRHKILRKQNKYPFHDTPDD